MTPPPSAARTARERARAELTREIKEEARRQLAAVGADGLSLRAVARELGMVSSALYRYYPSKDDLLTALIIDAYTAIGEAAETAIGLPEPGLPGPGSSEPGSSEPGSSEPGVPASAAAQSATAAASASASGTRARVRWLAACHAIRAWAVAHPHEYALIYGSPVPGYRAPEATIGPAARVPLAFATVLRDAVASGELAPAEGTAGGGAGGVGGAGPGAHAGRHVAAPPAEEVLPDDGMLADQAAALSAALSLEGGPNVRGDLLVRAVIAWTQLFGMLSFELFGQFVGSFDPTEAFFGYAAAQLAAFVGLP